MRTQTTNPQRQLLPNFKPRHGELTAGLAVFAAILWLISLPALAVGEKPLAENYYGDEGETFAAAYSYLRTVEGEATLLQENDERDYAQANQPLLTGDRLFLSNRTRVEAILSDRTVVRLESKTRLGFDALGASPDATAEGTILSLTAGEIQLTVAEELLSELYPRIETLNATIYIQDAGNYLITARRSGDTEVVVREGYAEVVTERGSTLVRADEELVVEEGELARTTLYDARSYTSLERWATRLEREAAHFNGDVDPELRYSAASLNGHGHWLRIDGRRAWRPRVTVGWRPYHAGRWSYTPSGLTWISSEPWGWVPYHYGSWDYVGHHGWVWYPGRHYAPAWVYWHWGNSYASWCPTGYYNTYYGLQYANLGYAPIFRWGTYGWSGGHSSHYDRWNFVDYENLGRHGQARFTRPGRELAVGRDDGLVDRGIITTDTRGLKPALLRRPGAAIEVLRTRPTADGRPATGLPDVTAFVARDRLDTDTEGRVIARRAPRLDGGRVAAIERPRLRATKPAVVAGPSSPASRVGVKPAPAVNPRADRAPRVRVAAPRAGQKPAVSNPTAAKPVRRAPRPRVESRPRATSPGVRTTPRTQKPASVTPPARNRVRSPRPATRRPEVRPSVRPSARRPSVNPSVRPSVKPSRERPAARQPAARPTSPRPSVRPSVRPRPRVSTPTPSRRDQGQKPSVRSGSTPSRSPAPRVRAPRTSSPRAASPRATKPQGSRPPQVRSQPRPAARPKPRASSKPRPSSKRPAVRSGGGSGNKGGSSVARTRSSSGNGNKGRSKPPKRRDG